MKSSITTALRRAHVWSGKKMPRPISSSSSAEPSTSASSASPEFPVSGSVTETAGSTSTTPSAVSASVTISETAKATATDYPLSFTETGSGTETASTTSSSASPTSTAPSCIDGQSDKANFTTSAGGIYQIICNQEYYGGDLSAVGAPTFEACIDACDLAPECVDVSWVGGMCYMKKELNALVIADGISTARKLSGPTLEPKAPLTCEGGSANGTIFKTDLGRFYEICCGFDFPGGDI